MAKTIKFNLVCDGQQVRTLEDLQNNFSIEDILRYYHDGILQKWLDVRGFNEELDKVKKIKQDSTQYDIVNELVSIFGVETDKNKIEYSTSIIEYKDKRIKADEKKKDVKEYTNSLFKKYTDRYEELTKNILDNPENKGKIQAAIKEIADQYSWVFVHDYRNFFYKIEGKSPLAVLCLLMNPFTRAFYISDGEESTDDSLLSRDIKEMYELVRVTFSNQLFIQNIIEVLGESVIKKIEKNTENRFTEVTSQKCMVILLDGNSSKCAVCNGNDEINFKKPDDVNGKFLIMDGIKYQSSEVSSLYYIEVE